MLHSKKRRVHAQLAGGERFDRDRGLIGVHASWPLHPVEAEALEVVAGLSALKTKFRGRVLIETDCATLAKRPEAGALEHFVASANCHRYIGEQSCFPRL